jgi:hypothetical protein
MLRRIATETRAAFSRAAEEVAVVEAEEVLIRVGACAIFSVQNGVTTEQIIFIQL